MKQISPALWKAFLFERMRWDHNDRLAMEDEPAEHRSHWSHPAVPPIRTKILFSTTGTTSSTEETVEETIGDVIASRGRLQHAFLAFGTDGDAALSADAQALASASLPCFMAGILAIVRG